MRLQKNVYISASDYRSGFSFPAHSQCPTFFLNNEALRRYGIDPDSIGRGGFFLATIDSSTPEKEESGFWALKDDQFLLSEVRESREHSRSYSAFGGPPTIDDHTLYNATFVSPHARARREGFLDSPCFDIDETEAEELRQLPYDTVFEIGFQHIVSTGSGTPRMRIPTVG